MSFRENLQHLRATRNMTQEQLAMLLGVSRQSVTKWEAEKSYPEMDKLLKICDLFDCSLDDLVSGDLTGRASEPAQAMPDGPAADSCGYDEHMRGFANGISAGVGTIILGVAASAVIDSLYVNSPLAPAAFFVLLAAGLALIIPAGVSHADFVRQHPFVEDFYTEDDRSKSARQLGTAIAAGVGLILLGLVPSIIFEGTWLEDVLGSAFLASVALAVWVFVRWGMLHNRLDIEGYNREGDHSRPKRPGVEESASQKPGGMSRTGAICAIIMLVATIVGLLLLFGSTALVSLGVRWALVSLQFFWLAWPIGGIVCAIVSIYLNYVSKG